MQRLKDKSRRKLLKKNEYLLISIKYLLNNPILKKNNNFLNILVNQNKKIFIFLNKNSLNKIKNYCIISNRSRGILKDFKISRIILKDYASKGFLMGLHKSSW